MNRTKRYAIEVLALDEAGTRAFEASMCGIRTAGRYGKISGGHREINARGKNADLIQCRYPHQPEDSTSRAVLTYGITGIGSPAIRAQLARSSRAEIPSHP